MEQTYSTFKFWVLPFISYNPAPPVRPHNGCVIKLETTESNCGLSSSQGKTIHLIIVGGWRIHKTYSYAGFISYAHKDESVAARLHRALETYSIPKALTSAESRAKLSPIFRDTAELTAHHSLSEKIRDAVQSSRFLIVLCSPAAKVSHWVNEEIRLFRTLHGEDSILCVLVEGTPETSFPPALLEDGREPLAANIGGSRDNFRLGTTQLAASMLGVGLDQLIQRDAKRRRNRFRLVTTASMGFAAVMGGMAWTAIDARDAAETSRSEAEKMTEFMLTDLKQDLEPLGKLNVLDDVGKRVSEYYSAIPLTEMDDDRLARQARARHLLAQVAMDQGNMEKAKSEIDAAYAATEEVLKQNPNDTDAIFAHAQSAYWVGAMFDRFEDVEKMQAPLSEYNNLGQKLYQSDPKNFNWVMEAAWGQNNLGLWARDHATKSKTQESIGYYSRAITYFKEAVAINPDSKSAQYELSNTLAGRALAELEFGTAERSRAFKLEQLVYLDQLVNQYPDDKNLYSKNLQARLTYYHDFFLTLSEAQEKQVKHKLHQLHKLTLFDLENIENKLWFLYYAFKYISKVGTQASPDLLSNIKESVSQLPDNIVDKDYYQTMLELTKKKQGGQKEVQDISAILLSESLDKHKKRRFLYLYFLQNKSPELAETLLLAINESTDATFPTILNQKMKAYLELNNCSQVSSLSLTLHSRGFFEPHQIECRAAN